MDKRVLFKKGEQRKFLNFIVKKINCVSIRGILQFGFDVTYSSLKNYYSERRLLPKTLYENLCYIGKVSNRKFKVKYLDSNFGQVRGGKK